MNVHRYFPEFTKENTENTIFNIKSIELFLKKYKLEQKYKYILYNFISSNLATKFYGICSSWYNMCQQIERYL